MTTKINSLEFQKKLKQRLETALKQKLKNSLHEEQSDNLFIDDEEETEESDDDSEVEEPGTDDTEEESEPDYDEGLERTSEENKAVLEIQKKASEAGVDISGYMHGVFQLDFDKREEVDKFMDFIEDFEPVESFELKSCDEEGNESEESDDCAFYRFWVYLKPEIISYDYYDAIHSEDEDDEEMEDDGLESEEDELADEETEEDLDSEETESEDDEEKDEIKESYIMYLSEMQRKMKVNYLGKKRVKMQCAPGYKYNHKTKVCEKIQGSMLANLRRGVKKTLITKSQGGLALKRRTAFRTKRADKFRQGYGL